MNPRLLLAFLTVLFTVAEFQPVSAAPLNSNDLRRLGFTGNYRGSVRGDLAVKDGSNFDTFFINQSAREQLPPRNRSVVTGTSGRNGYFLNLQRITGNARRATIRYYYSGRSFNPNHDEDCIGTGTKVLKVLKRGISRPQFEMKLIDKLNERAADNGEYLAYWKIRGLLFK